MNAVIELGAGYDDLAAQLTTVAPEGREHRILVFAPPRRPAEDWAAVRATLLRAFELTRATLDGVARVVYVVEQADLLGQRGAPAAMLACALLSGARSLSLEGARRGHTANVVAIGPSSDPEEVAVWVRASIVSSSGGNLVRVGVDHLGRALP